MYGQHEFLPAHKPRKSPSVHHHHFDSVYYSISAPENGCCGRWNTSPAIVKCTLRWAPTHTYQTAPFHSDISHFMFTMFPLKARIWKQNHWYLLICNRSENIPVSQKILAYSHGCQILHHPMTAQSFLKLSDNKLENVFSSFILLFRTFPLPRSLAQDSICPASHCVL